MLVTRQQLEAEIEAIREATEDPRCGIYGPGSTSWRIGRESGLFLGGGRAALLQLAHPWVAHAVDQHSKTREDPLGRFQRTFDNVLAMVFGDLDTAFKSARRVHNIHTRITGKITESAGSHANGSEYMANQVDALFWVHATLVDSAILTYDLLFKPLTFAEKDDYYRESKRFARLFGIPHDAMPDGWSEFEAYMQRMFDSDELFVGRPALELRELLFTAPRPVVAPTFKVLEALTGGMMPPRFRREFGFGDRKRDERAYQAATFALRKSLTRLPRVVRFMPAYLEAERRIAGRPDTARLSRMIERVALKALTARTNS